MSAFLLILLFSLFSVPAYSENSNAGSYVPDINIYLSNAETGSGNATPGKITKIKARVVYEGCAEGEEYVLVLRLEDTSSGAICMFSDGSASLKQAFTAESRSGFFEFEFEIDAGRFSGRTLAEIHHIEGMEWASAGSGTKNSGHIYVPEIRNDAVSQAGQKTVLAGKNTVICGVISYYGFAPGEEYRLVTGLKDSLTGEIICGDDGNPVSSSSKFTPTKPNGQIAAKITANLRDYGNRNVTLFEDIYIVPKTGIPFLLLSSESDSEEYRTVFARLAEISVLDEMYKTPISGAGLKITSAADGSAFEGVSDEDGKCSFPLDANKINVCTVTSVPDEYLPCSGSVEFTPTDAEGGTAFCVYLLKKNTIVITRTDAETGLPLHGVVTEVRDSEGNPLSTIFSDEEGKARFDAGPYWNQAAEAAEQEGKSKFILTLSFADCSTPSAYYPKENSWTVSIDENGNITGLTELQSVKRRQLAVTVVNGTGNGIPGVELSIIDKGGSIQGRAITDHEGRIYFTPKRTGEYRLVEDTLPPGYARSLGKKQFTVEENGEISGTLTITNLSEDLTSGVATVAVITVLSLAAWFSASFFVKKAIREKVKTFFENTGKHSK